MSADAGTNVTKFLQSVFKSTNPEQCGTTYDEWAKTYDTDVRHAEVDYVAPELTAQTVVAAGGNLSGSILDAGCGTGLVGVALAQAGAKNIDGIDISQGMLDVARKSGKYNNLSVVNMTKAIGKQDGSYDVVTCCGTFTEAHVGAVPALQELVRVLKDDGFLVCTVLDTVWESMGFKDEVARLEALDRVRVSSITEMDYRRGTNTKARMVVLQRN